MGLSRSGMERLMSDRTMPEDPTPDSRGDSDMGEGSFRESTKGGESPPSVKGPRKVRIPGSRSDGGGRKAV
jgi:hypothetical protein